MLQVHDSTPPGQRGVLWAVREAEHLRTTIREAERRLAWMEWAEQATLRNGFAARNIILAVDLLEVHPAFPAVEKPVSFLRQMAQRRTAYDNAIRNLAFHRGFSEFVEDGFSIAWIGGENVTPPECEMVALILTAVRNGDLYWPGDPRMPLPSSPDAFEDGEEDGSPAVTNAPQPPPVTGGCACHPSQMLAAEVRGLTPRQWKEQLRAREETGHSSIGIACVPTLGTQLAEALDDEMARSRELHPGNKAMLKTLRRQSGDLTAALVENDGAAAIRREALQTATVALRIYLEGDADYATPTAPEGQVSG